MEEDLLNWDEEPEAEEKPTNVEETYEEDVCLPCEG
tara:strand:- start:1988 stop:2095 length:108 start_codon:yes stop_codon:yes gene_type:complete